MSAQIEDDGKHLKIYAEERPRRRVMFLLFIIPVVFAFLILLERLDGNDWDSVTGEIWGFSLFAIGIPILIWGRSRLKKTIFDRASTTITLSNAQTLSYDDVAGFVKLIVVREVYNRELRTTLTVHDYVCCYYLKRQFPQETFTQVESLPESVCKTLLTQEISRALISSTTDAVIAQLKKELTVPSYDFSQQERSTALVTIIPR